jgi:hypothetical protein
MECEGGEGDDALDPRTGTPTRCDPRPINGLIWVARLGSGPDEI